MQEMMQYNSELCMGAADAGLLATAVREGAARAPPSDAAEADCVQRFATFCDVAAEALGFSVE